MGAKVLHGLSLCRYSNHLFPPIVASHSGRAVVELNDGHSTQYLHDNGIEVADDHNAYLQAGHENLGTTLPDMDPQMFLLRTK